MSARTLVIVAALVALAAPFAAYGEWSKSSGPSVAEAGRALLGHAGRGDLAQGDLEEEPRPDDVHLGAERDAQPWWKDRQGEAGHQGGLQQGRSVSAAEPLGLGDPRVQDPDNGRRQQERRCISSATTSMSTPARSCWSTASPGSSEDQRQVADHEGSRLESDSGAVEKEGNHATSYCGGRHYGGGAGSGGSGVRQLGLRLRTERPEACRPVLDRPDRGDLAPGCLEEEPRSDDDALGAERDVHASAGRPTRASRPFERSSSKAGPFQPQNHWISETPAYKIRTTVSGNYRDALLRVSLRRRRHRQGRRGRRLPIRTSGRSRASG